MREVGADGGVVAVTPYVKLEVIFDRVYFPVTRSFVWWIDLDIALDRMALILIWLVLQ